LEGKDGSRTEEDWRWKNVLSPTKREYCERKKTLEEKDQRKKKDRLKYILKKESKGPLTTGEKKELKMLHLLLQTKPALPP
jgi:hypothetical protein